MRVLIAAVGHFDDTPSGSAAVALDESQELARRGDEVWVLASAPSNLPEHEIRHGVHLLRYHPAKVASWNPARRSAHQNAATALLAKYLPQVDAIHGHVPLPYLAALHHYGNAVPASYTIHSPVRLEMAIVWSNASPLRRIFAPLGLAVLNRMEAECLRRSRVITALSQYTIDCIGRIHGRDVASSVKLTPGWVDTSRFVPVDDRAALKETLGWPADVPVFFTLRRLVARMGLNRLLDACHELFLAGLKFHLVIGGRGPLHVALEQQAQSLGIRPSVTFLGRVDDRDLPLAYAACDAFVLPTTALECFGLIALEALSAGRPVLATPIAAIPEIMNKFEPAWLSASASSKDIADLLRRYLASELPMHDPTRMHQQVHRDYSRERALKNFIEATVRKA